MVCASAKSSGEILNVDLVYNLFHLTLNLYMFIVTIDINQNITVSNIDRTRQATRVIDCFWDHCFKENMRLYVKYMSQKL